MHRELMAVTETLNNIRKIEANTDAALAELNSVGKKASANAKALHHKLMIGKIDQTTFDQQMDLLTEWQRKEGEKIEAKYHLANAEFSQ